MKSFQSFNQYLHEQDDVEMVLLSKNLTQNGVKFLYDYYHHTSMNTEDAFVQVCKVFGLEAAILTQILTENQTQTETVPLTLDEIEATGNMILVQNNQRLVTQEGNRTFNYWYKTKENTWIKYDTKIR
jgi:hypothetical protein